MKKLYVLLIALPLLAGAAAAQDFMLQAWYWDYPKTCNGKNWADSLLIKEDTIASGGFTYLWPPPMSRASFGSCSNGYDPKDLYDLGEFGGGATGFGTRADVDELVAALSADGVKTVADVVYNHRDGGAAETNTAVKDYITNYYNETKNAFPSDRFRCALPLGGSSGNNAGAYYIKINSKTSSSNFYSKPYKIYVVTNTVGWQNQADGAETEPNCNSDCDPSSCSGNNPASVFPTTITLGRNFQCSIDAIACNTDEFFLDLNTADFNAAGDFLYIYMANDNGDYSDHRPWGLWRHNDGDQNGAQVISQVTYQTYTNFNSLPSGQGGMNFENFKPNTGNAASTSLSGDWDWLWFFYDYDQSVASTRTGLFDWTKWLWTNAGIRGFRMDAVKHFDYAFTGDLLDDLNMAGYNPGMAVGELFDGNPDVLRTWIANVESNMNTATKNAIKIRAFDFALRQSLKDACDAFGYDARNVFTSGMVDASGTPVGGEHVVTFVNNHDFRDAGQPVQNNPMLAYAYILTNNKVGLPCVFYPEYFGKPVTNYPANTNLRTKINQLIAIHEAYIYNSSFHDYLSRIGTGYAATYASGYPTTTLLFQMAGGIAGKDVLVCINFAGEALNVTHQINGNLDGAGSNSTPPGTTFTELTTNSTTPTLTVSGTYQVNIQLPAFSYAVWVQGSALPVELLDFQAKPLDREVALTWKVANENRLEGYELQRSPDGQEFAPLEWISAKASGQERAAYASSDRSPVLGKTMYYRLKMKDLDGSFTFSQVRTALLEEGWSKPLFVPNPTDGNTLLLLEAKESCLADLTILDTTGRVVFSKKLAVEEGRGSFELPTDGLPGGTYLVRLECGGRRLWMERLSRL